MKPCPNCGEEIIGRLGKKFCTPYCKSNYHYERNKQKESSLYRNIDKQLKINRRILKNYNKAGKATIRKEALMTDGFNPSFFTHYWKNKQVQVYLFCYEYGFLAFTDPKGIAKFTLVRWQDYMGSEFLK